MAEPDYKTWVEKSRWRVFEGISLVLGIEPPVDAPSAVKLGPEGVINKIAKKEVRPHWGRLYEYTKNAMDLKDIEWTEDRLAGKYIERGVEPCAFCALAESKGFALPKLLSEALELVDAASTGTPTEKPVSSSRIIRHFVVELDEQRNREWWNVRMREAKRYGLVEARALRGQGKAASMWYPLRISRWLTDKGHMEESKVESICRKNFLSTEDIAEDLER